MKLHDACPYLAGRDERLIHNQGALGRLAPLGSFGFPAICLIVQAVHNTMGALTLASAEYRNKTANRWGLFLGR
jgi:hypothetical protein